MKIKLFIKNDSIVKKIAKEIQQELIKNNFKIVEKNYDIAISIGGDGTFLKMIHENTFNDNIMYYGINAGALGFLTDINKDELNIFIKSIKEKKYHKKKLSIIKTNIYTDNNKTEIYSLNEILVKRSNSSLLKVDVYVNDILLENYTGDGLLVSTPAGSTAYNLSLNGSIIDNDLNVFTLVPMAPIKTSIFKSLNNSLILSKTKEIELVLNNKQNMHLINDGKVLNINNVRKINISLSSKYVSLITIKDNDFITKINNKIIG